MRSLLSLATSRRGRAVFALGFFAILGVGTVNLDSRSVYARADAWAAARANNLPDTLGELAAYPKAYRDAIIKAMPAADKSRLWHEQLQGLLDTRHDLNADQRAFIVRTMALATPASFEPHAEHPTVCQDIATLFPDPDMREQVSKLATTVAPQRRVRTVMVSALEKVRTLVNVRADMECNCAGTYAVCNGCWSTTCQSGNCSQGAMCGCIWLTECWGVCADPGGGGGSTSTSTRPGTQTQIK